MPRLSVIIPTFNRRVLVERAAKSVLTQSDPIGIELIVSDDASTDGTIEHLQSRFAEDVASGRLKLLTHPSSGDPATNRNRGARAAQGEFLAFLDSDDWWKPTRLAHLAPLLESGPDLILASNAYARAQSRDWLREYLKVNLGNSSTVVVRRALFEELEGFPENYFGPKSRWNRGFEDYEFWLRALQSTERSIVIPNTDVVIEPTPGGAGTMPLREQMRREIATLLRVLPGLTPVYWPLVAKRVGGASKAWLLGR